jgi:hypothetical protein
VKRTAPATVEARHALATRREDLAGLRARRDLDRDDGLVRKRDLAGGPEGGFGHRQAKPGREIVAVTLELGVGREVDVDEEIAGRPALRPGQALRGDTKSLAGVDACGERHHDLAALLDLAGAATRLAGRLHHGAFASALGQDWVNMTKPRAVDTWPWPPQAPHVFRFVPGFAPVPSHVSHAAGVRSGTSRLQPVTDSFSVMRCWTRMSCPRDGPL